MTQRLFVTRRPSAEDVSVMPYHRLPLCPTCTDNYNLAAGDCEVCGADGRQRPDSLLGQELHVTAPGDTDAARLVAVGTITAFVARERHGGFSVFGSLASAPVTNAEIGAALNHSGATAVVLHPVTEANQPYVECGHCGGTGRVGPYSAVALCRKCYEPSKRYGAGRLPVPLATPGVMFWESLRPEGDEPADPYGELVARIEERRQSYAALARSQDNATAQEIAEAVRDEMQRLLLP